MSYTPGSDVAGRVLAIGADMSRVRVGDRVVASAFNGALARTCLLPASAHVVTVPAEASAGDLSALPMAGLTAIDILRHLGEISGRTLAILGATGGVGLALTRLATDRGARVIASAKPVDAEIVRLNGAAEVVDYTTRDFIDRLRASHPEGVDVLVDLVSMFDSLLRSAEAVREGGVLVSTLFGPPPEAFGNRVTIIYQRLAAQPGDLQSVVDAFLAGRLRANVTRTFPFADAPAAYRAWSTTT